MSPPSTLSGATALFVHGMGRSPLSGRPLLRHLQRAGCAIDSFGYSVALQRADAIVERLAMRVAQLARDGELLLIGHSLGGVLLREALRRQPVVAPRVRCLVLLGSPVQASRAARRLQSWPLVRWLSGDCGRWLASPEQMAAIGPPAVATLGIAGTRGLPMTRWLFDGEPNDGVVSLAEVSASWLDDQTLLPVLHTWLPLDRRVAEVILRRSSDGAAG